MLRSVSQDCWWQPENVDTPITIRNKILRIEIMNIVNKDPCDYNQNSQHF
jgi:hypothetical protein